jgi:hypothetical protein
MNKKPVFTSGSPVTLTFDPTALKSIGFVFRARRRDPEAKPNA